MHFVATLCIPTTRQVHIVGLNESDSHHMAVRREIIDETNRMDTEANLKLDRCYLNAKINVRLSIRERYLILSACEIRGTQVEFTYPTLEETSKGGTSIPEMNGHKPTLLTSLGNSTKGTYCQPWGRH